MIRLRAFVFNTLFYGLLVLYMLAAIVAFALPRRVIYAIARSLAKHGLALQRLFGMEIELRGAEHLDRGGSIVAAKHQSMWETFALFFYVRDAAFIYKQELGRIPLFGAYLRKLELIEINRKGGARAFRAMATAARAAIDEGRQLVIFPEGTRRPPGAEPKYKYGVAKIYADVARPVVPIVLNSGLFWSSYFWRGRTGKLVVEVLPVIEPGLDADAFFTELQRVMEAASDRLIVETARDLPRDALPPAVMGRLEAAAKSA